MIDIVSHSWLDVRMDSQKDLPPGVRGALAQARLSIEVAAQKPVRKRRSEYVPEDDALTREQIEEARS